MFPGCKAHSLFPAPLLLYAFYVKLPLHLEGLAILCYPALLEGTGIFGGAYLVLSLCDLLAPLNLTAIL